jgi:hypothetical protein
MLARRSLCIQKLVPAGLLGGRFLMMMTDGGILEVLFNLIY